MKIWLILRQVSIHSMCFKWYIYNDFHSSAFYKGRVISALIVCHSHFPSNSFLLSSFLSICIENSPWYQYFIFTEKNIFVFTHKENIFTSQFSQIYLFPGIWVSSDKWRPRVQTKCDRGPIGDQSGPRRDGGRSRSHRRTRSHHGLLWSAGIKLGCFEDKYRDYEFSFDPSNGNCVGLCCYSRPGYSVVVLPGLLSLSKLRDRRKYLSCLLIYVCDHLFPSNKQRQYSHEPGQCVQTLHIPSLQFMA